LEGRNTNAGGVWVVQGKNPLSLLPSRWGDVNHKVHFSDVREQPRIMPRGWCWLLDTLTGWQRGKLMRCRWNERKKKEEKKKWVKEKQTSRLRLLGGRCEM